jgi:hypothetical protein
MSAERIDATLPVRLPPRPSTPATAPEPAPAPAVPRRRAVTGPRLLLWILVFAVGITGGYLGYRAVEDEPASSAAPPTPVARALPIVSVQDYDPAGDGHESPDEVAFVHDGNEATVWSTEDYFDRDVGGRKPGVGLVIGLGSAKLVDRVEVDSPDHDWSGAVYTSDTVPTELAGWGAPKAIGSNLPDRARLLLQPPTRASNVLLWITNLPPSSSGTFKLRIGEVRVVGTP